MQKKIGLASAFAKKTGTAMAVAAVPLAPALMY